MRYGTSIVTRAHESTQYLKLVAPSLGNEARSERHLQEYTRQEMPADASTILFLCSGNYYRSRFAEHLFNHLVKDTALPHRSDSAGLWPDCRQHNPGPIAAQTIQALVQRGVSLPQTHRIPRDVIEADIRGA